MADITLTRVNIQLSPEVEVNSGGGYMCISGREASRYISSAVHRP